MFVFADVTLYLNLQGGHEEIQEVRPSIDILKGGGHGNPKERIKKGT
jgi:hypothetical protein